MAIKKTNFNPIGENMSNIPEIKSTKDYNLFQRYESNRKPRPLHVLTLVQDKTFPYKFPTSPIVVNSNFFIIDGQHRYWAARELGIPIYYIIDPTADEEDIKIRNTQLKAWDGLEFVHYFSKKNYSYQIFLDIKEKHKLNKSIITAGILKICNLKRIKFFYEFKNGTLKIEKYENTLKEFFNLVIPVLKSTRASRGEQETRPLFQDAYITAFAHFFIHDEPTFFKILSKLKSCSIDIPFNTQYEKARFILEKIGKWKKSGFKKSLDIVEATLKEEE